MPAALPLSSSAASPSTVGRSRLQRVTVKDVAARAGASHSSVSVVLNNASGGNTGVSAATRERILMAAQELGYKRNGSMAAMRTGRTGSIALLLSTNEHRSFLPQRMWEGIHDELAASNITLTMVRLPDEQLTDEGAVPKILREWMCDGLLVDYTNHIPGKMIDLIHAHQLPAVWINSQQEADCVYPDERAAGRFATEHLLELGHTEVVYMDLIHFLDDAGEHFSALARRTGYEEAMRQAGLQASFIEDARLPYDQQKQQMKGALLGPQRSTAFVCYGDIEAEQLIRVAQDENLRPGREFSLIEFGSKPRFSGGSLVTTLTWDEKEAGRRAAQMLLQKIECPDEQFAPQIVPFTFEAGQTCRPLHPAS